MRMSEEQYAAYQRRAKAPNPRAKFKNIRTRNADGSMAASKWEAERLAQLELMEKAGEIRELRTQVSYPLMVGDTLIGAYVADAVYFDVRRNCKVVEDAKGCKTQLYRWKARHFKAQFGFAITEVKRP